MAGYISAKGNVILVNTMSSESLIMVRTDIASINKDLYCKMSHQMYKILGVIISVHVLHNEGICVQTH